MDREAETLEAPEEPGPADLQHFLGHMLGEYRAWPAQEAAESELLSWCQFAIGAAGVWGPEESDSDESGESDESDADDASNNDGPGPAANNPSSNQENSIQNNAAPGPQDDKKDRDDTDGDDSEAAAAYARHVRAYFGPNERDAVEGRLRTSGGVTLMHVAAASGLVAVVRALARRGADADARTVEGVTPLRLAARLGHARVAEALLDAGACPDSRRCERGAVGLATPLHDAARHGRTSLCAALLARGATLDARGSNGETPFEVAATTLGSERAAFYLLRCGARAPLGVGESQLLPEGASIIGRAETRLSPLSRLLAQVLRRWELDAAATQRRRRALLEAVGPHLCQDVARLAADFEHVVPLRPLSRKRSELRLRRSLRDSIAAALERRRRRRSAPAALPVRRAP